jgi:hypothetical protein
MIKNNNNKLHMLIKMIEETFEYFVIVFYKCLHFKLQGMFWTFDLPYILLVFFFILELHSLMKIENGSIF